MEQPPSGGELALDAEQMELQVPAALKPLPGAGEQPELPGLLPQPGQPAQESRLRPRPAMGF